ncbi:MAG: hypothetical protein Q8K32_26530 [Archangium sp.]|nr:hypothetical protein [Archangium sp.]
MNNMRNKLKAAALAGGLATFLSPIHAGAQAPEDDQPTRKTTGSQPSSKKDSAKDQGKADSKRPALLIGVVTITPLPAKHAKLPTGARYDAKLPHADELRASLASVTGAVFGSDGELNDVIDKLVDLDRDRMDKHPLMETDFDQKQLSALKAKVSQIKKSFEDKYGEPFKIAKNEVYAPLQFAEGEITDAAQFSQRWPVVLSSTKQGSSAPKSSAAAGKEQGLSEKVREQGNIEAGRDFGIAQFPAEAGLPVTMVSFIDEAFGWKIDVSDSLTTSQLRDNLLKQLTAMSQQVDTWPANVNDAYRLASHHVAIALVGTPGSQS